MSDNENDNERNLQASQYIDISVLPDELMYAIFRCFDILKLMPFSRVCKQWKCLIDDPRLRKVLNFSYKCVQKMITDDCLPMIRILSTSGLLHTFKAACNIHNAVNHVIPVLAENCQHLSILELSGCRNINEESWQLIGAAPWPRLTHLSLQSCGVDNNILATILPTLITVTVLNITANDITDDGITCITGHTPSLQCLLLHGNHDLTSASTVPLLDDVGERLTQLSLHKVVDRTLLTALPTACVCLRVLVLGIDIATTDAFIGCLQKLTHLTHIHLRFWEALASAMYERASALSYIADANACDEGLGLRKLEYLQYSGSYDPHLADGLLRYITGRCGGCLRYLVISRIGIDILHRLLIDVDHLCTSLEHLEVKGYNAKNKITAFAMEVPIMPRLQVFALERLYKLNPIQRDHLATMMPNAVICSFEDLYSVGFYSIEYKRSPLADIFRQVLQPVNSILK